MTGKNLLLDDSEKKKVELTPWITFKAQGEVCMHEKDCVKPLSLSSFLRNAVPFDISASVSSVVKQVENTFFSI